MTEKQKQAIRDLRRQGMSYLSIADSVGLSPNTVKSFCRRNHICVAVESAAGGICKNCGKPLIHCPGARRKIFCGNQCRYAWWNKNRLWAGKKKQYRLTCLYCGTAFEGTKSKKYCGRDCYVRSRYGEGPT